MSPEEGEMGGEPTGEQTAPDATGEADLGQIRGGGDPAETGPQEGATEGQQQGDETDEFVKGEDGTEYVPRKAFEARIAKLTAQKHESADAASFLETIKNDPAARQQFVDALGVGKPDGADQSGPTGPNTWDSWLQKHPPEYQSHYREMAQALAPEFESFVEKFVGDSIEKAISPLRRWVGDTEVTNFSQKVKNFGEFRPAVQGLMEKHPNLYIEQAYKLASYDSVFGRGRKVGQQTTQQRKVKIGGLPPRGGPGGAPTGSGPMDLDAAVSKALDSAGIR